jgi:hypothetical protein
MAKIQKVYFANAGVPETGLSPVWLTLKKVSDGSDFTPQPAITEIGGGWYKFTQPTDLSEDLTGVVDGTVTLADADRYVPVNLTPDDFGMTDLIDALIEGSQELDPNTNELIITRRDGSTVLVTYDLVKTAIAIGAYLSRTPK